MEEEISFCVEVRILCKTYNILYIADEVRMGACKTGKTLSSDWFGPEHKPDMITMGKSISGGAYPASFVLGPDSVMNRVQPYDTLSTFAGTAMACAVVNASLDVWEEEHLEEKASAIHEKWTREVASWDRAKIPYLKLATAFGADMNLFFDTAYESRVERVTPRRFSLLCASRGLHVYPGLNGRVRLGVALTISDEDLYKGFTILRQALEELPLYGDIELDE
jgi:ornithine--oxo-acid transaminase